MLLPQRASSAISLTLPRLELSRTDLTKAGINSSAAFCHNFRRQVGLLARPQVPCNIMFRGTLWVPLLFQASERVCTPQASARSQKESGFFSPSSVRPGFRPTPRSQRASPCRSCSARSQPSSSNLRKSKWVAELSVPVLRLGDDFHEFWSAVHRQGCH